MRGSANAVPKYNDKTFQTGIKMPEINHKARDKSRGIHTRKSAEPRAHGNSAETGTRPGAGTAFQAQQTQNCAAAQQHLSQLRCA